jgi:glycosyltransferase involved in cell wall biosynthesis
VDEFTPTDYNLATMYRSLAPGALPSTALRVAVVIPAFNEARAIYETVATVPELVDHIIVVDDASSDDTLERARAGAALRAQPTCVEVFRHTANRGVGGAIATGYRRALELSAHVAVVMAGDGQMDPADLPRLLEPIARGEADYVKGNRFKHPDVWTTMPPTRIFGNVVLSAATRLTSGYRHVFDSQCGYTAIHRRALVSLDLDLLWARYGYPNDLLSRLRVHGMRVVDVPVRPIYGEHWKSGIRIATALHSLPWVLLRSWGARVAAQTRKRVGSTTRRAVPAAAPHLHS